MDQSELAVLQALGARAVWGVDELPPEADIDMLRCLDLEELVEVRFVTMNWSGKPSGVEPQRSPSPSQWFSPMKEPTMAGSWETVLKKQVRDCSNHPHELRISEKGRALLARVKRVEHSPATVAQEFLNAIRQRLDIHQQAVVAYGNRRDVDPLGYAKLEAEAAELASDLFDKEPSLVPPPRRFAASSYGEYLERLCEWGEKAIHLERQVRATSQMPEATSIQTSVKADILPDPWRDPKTTVDDRVRLYMLHLSKHGKSARPTCRELASIIGASDSAIADTPSWKAWGRAMVTGKLAEESPTDRHVHSAVKEAEDARRDKKD